MERLQKFPMPDVGECLTEAEILEWKVGVGDELTVNQIMVEIETAKAAVELPSPHAGRVHALLVEPGITVDVGTPIIVIDTQPDAGPVAGDGPSGSAGSAAAAQVVQSGARPDRQRDGRILHRQFAADRPSCCGTGRRQWPGRRPDSGAAPGVLGSAAGHSAGPQAREGPGYRSDGGAAQPGRRGDHPGRPRGPGRRPERGPRSRSVGG